MNRYEDEYLDEIPEENPYLGSNIKTLRIEARIKESELAEIVGVDTETIINWEKGKSTPTVEEIKKMLPKLRISHYDIMTRNITLERNEAEKKMMKSKDRKNYNWFYGDKTKVLLDIIYLISVPVIFLLLAFPLKKVILPLYQYTDFYSIIGASSSYLVAYALTSLINGILIVIKILTHLNYKFQIWHIFWISLIIVIVEVAGIIGTIPYYIYYSKINNLKGEKSSMIRKCFTINPNRTIDEINSYEEHLVKTGIFAGCEIFYPYKVTQEQYDNYCKGVNSYLKYDNFEIVCHLPYGAENNVATYVNLDDTMNRLKKGIDFASLFNVTKLTFHPGELDGTLPREEALELSIKKVRELASYAKKYNMTYMIENLIGEKELCARIEEMEYYLSSLEDLDVKLIFDCAHCHNAYKGELDAVINFIEKFKDKVTHLHISDNHGERDEHAPLLSGTIKYKEYFKWLKDNNYNGLYSSEVLFKDYDDLLKTSNTIDLIEKEI